MIDAVKTAYEKAAILDPAAIRFIATETACITTKKAVAIIAEKESGKLHKILGVDRSNAIVAMFLTMYCNPAIDDIVTQTINWQVNLHDPSFSGDRSPPNFEAILAVHLKNFSLDDAIAVVKGFGTEKKTPEYFGAIAMNRVNTPTYCATRNWKDHGIIYQYRISSETIEIKCGDSAWRSMAPLPFSGTPLSIAADNNRLLVLTNQHELWWYCAIDDQATWSFDIMKTAVAFLKLKPVIGEQLTNVMLPVFIEITDSIMQRASSVKHLESWKKRAPTDSSTRTYWKEKCSLWTDIALSVDKQILKTDRGASFSAANYSDWSTSSHKGGNWTNLLAWKYGEDTLTRGHNLAVETITDIAIGNWNGTVITMYALSKGKIWFLDEEIIQPEWKPIEKWNSGWVLIGQKEYHELSDSPYPLDSSAQIDASNSVVAVLHKKAGSTAISWLRWDYHQKDDFIYWPLDWCNHGWRTVEYPDTTVTSFRISTIENIDPREKNTVWSIPAPAFTFYEYIPQRGYEGIFADMPRKMVDTYPVDLFVGTTTDTVFHFSAKRSEDVKKASVKWKMVR